MQASHPGNIDTVQLMRARRLVQIARMVMCALALATIPYLTSGRWLTAAVLSGGVCAMLLCLWCNRQGRTAQAGAILLLSMMAMSCTLMWVSEGLRDVALLAFPVILVMAGLLVPGRAYAVLTAAMLLFVIGMTVATDILGWRANTPPADHVDYMRDVLLILVLGGFSVWVMAGDMNKALLGLQEQIDRYRASQVELTYLSQHDALTGLPNRALGRDRIEQAIAYAARNSSRVALLFVDLDHFKAINDSLGHAAGDDFLKQVAERLRAAVRKSDIVTRHGGDEFVIGLTDVGQIDSVSAAATTLLDQLSHHFTVRDTEISTSCSIGIALYPDDGEDYETLLREADIAMYQAKEAGRNAFRCYDEAMNANIRHNLAMVAKLRTALARGEFVLHYQPVVNLASGRLVGAEALVRWQHPEQGLVGPLDFIPLAEKSGLIVEIGEWVLGEACRQLVAWQRTGGDDFVMAVNLSTVQFRRGNVEAVVAEALRLSGLRPCCLELEITESTLVQDADAFMGTLQRLKALGVKISIDDFGTGYSNLSYLQRFAVDKLKIDRSFVMRLQDGPQDRALVTAIINMAKSLELATTAEGIEDEAVRAALCLLGCEQGQGYLFARPQPAAEFARQAFGDGAGYAARCEAC